MFKKYQDWNSIPQDKTEKRTKLMFFKITSKSPPFNTPILASLPLVEAPLKFLLSI